MLHVSRQSLTCKVSHPEVMDFYFTAVYAANTSEERNDLWVEIILLKDNFIPSGSPWCIGGNFNEILHPVEHSLPSVTQFSAAMIDFKSCLDQIEVRDLRFHGPTLTWSYNQQDNPIAKKLDRALINEHWISAYPNSLAT